MSPVPKTAMVLAAGLGTRMRPLTDDRPKALVEVAGQALIDHVLRRLGESGVDRAVVNVHWFAERLESHLAARAEGPEILISDERAELLETGGGLKKAAPLLGEDPDFTNWFQKGEIDLACTIVTNARGARKNGVKVAWTIPQEGAKVDTDALWIPKGLPANEVYWAKQYVNYALTADAQQGWCDGLGLPGVNPNIKPPADMVGDPAYPTKPEDFAKLLRVPNRIQVENEKEWFGKFKKIMQS